MIIYYLEQGNPQGPQIMQEVSLALTCSHAIHYVERVADINPEVDIVLLGASMALETIGEIRERFDCKIIVLTSPSMTRGGQIRFAMDCCAKGADDFVRAERSPCRLHHDPNEIAFRLMKTFQGNKRGEVKLLGGIRFNTKTLDLMGKNDAKGRLNKSQSILLKFFCLRKDEWVPIATAEDFLRSSYGDEGLSPRVPRLVWEIRQELSWLGAPAFETLQSSSYNGYRVVGEDHG